LTSNLRTSAMSVTDIVYFPFMCSSCRSNKNPQTVKLTLTSSGQNPSEPICKTIVAETTKPPAYPFFIINVKERSFRQKSVDPPVTQRIHACLVFRFSGQSWLLSPPLPSVTVAVPLR